MKKLLLLTAVLAMSFSAMAKNLEGRYFGHVKYDGKKRQVGLLLNKIENEKDSYYGVVSEYLSPFREDNFIADFFRPGKKKLLSKKRNGYLKELYRWIRIYKFVKKEGTNQFEMQKVKVEDGKIIALKNSDDSILTLGKRKKKPLKRATITTKIGDKEVTLKFKRTRRFPLKSTWEKKYIPGPYNPGYKQGDIVILNLLKDYNKDTKEATAIFNVEELKGQPIFIKGEFTVKEVHKGMFIYTDKRTTATEGANLVEDKIGVFLDVYNFQPIMNTVELVLIDPADPYGSQMYFEKFGNPDNK